MAVQAVDTAFREVARRRVRRLKDDHVHRVADDGVRQPVHAGVRLAALRGPCEHDRVVAAVGQRVHHVAQVRRRVVAPLADVAAGVVEVAVLLGGLADSQALRRPQDVGHLDNQIAHRLKRRKRAHRPPQPSSAAGSSGSSGPSPVTSSGSGSGAGGPFS